MSTIHRAYPRIPLNEPIQYTASTSPEWHPSRLLNFSEDGMCLKTKKPLEPMEEISVVMENYVPGRFGPEGYRSYLARVCWIQPVAAPESGPFAAGAQIITKSHEVPTGFTEESPRTCNLCGVLMPASQLESIDENAYLCKYCHGLFQMLPKRLRRSLTRFLKGNVV